MKRYILLISLIILLAGCGTSNVNASELANIDYKQEMRDFVQEISKYAKGIDKDFIIIPQNGQEIITKNGEPDASPVFEYLAAIDGIGREDLFYGYDTDNEPTDEDEKDYLISFCDLCKKNDVKVFVTDYCSAYDKIDRSYTLNQEKGYISFAAPKRELNIIPDYPSQPNNVNSNDVINLENVKNFLYLINNKDFVTKQDFINDLSATNYDLIIMDYFLNDQAFLKSEIAKLKIKQNSGKRLVISYLSIGEAEDYRYYWQNDWETNPPGWLEDENPDWKGNYKVRYWYGDWQNIIFGADNSYLKKILDAGFDGVYLDIIDAFEYHEKINN